MTGEAKLRLKTLMDDLNISTSDLATKLSELGAAETKASIDSKISRGTFSADFFLQCLSAMKVWELDMKDVSVQVPEMDVTESDQKQPFQVFEDQRTNTQYITTEDKPLNYQPSVVSLFSGAGGFDLGLENAGFKTLACIDFDADCRETLTRNRPEWIVVDNEQYIKKFGKKDRVPGDIRNIEPSELLQVTGKKVGQIDLVVGGAPCQPFSNMGKKKGKEDEQNGDLFLHFVRFVKELKPKAFIFENVVGITQSKHRDIINYMESQFEGMKFRISHSVLNAANYGVPQRRERFFMIGFLGDKYPAFPLPTHFKSEEAWRNFTSGFNFVPSQVPKPWYSVGEAFKNLPKYRQRRSDYAQMGVSEPVEERMQYVGVGQNFKVVPAELLPNCWKSGKHVGSDTFGRLNPSEPSVTIRTAGYNPSKGRYIHPYENRGLDTIEMAKLQDFPTDWCFYCRDRKRVTLVSAGRQIGNAVPPTLAQILGYSVKMQIF